MAAGQLRSIRPWIVFAGIVLVIAVLDWGEPVLLPVAVAILLTFLLNPPVSALQRVIGRPVAVVLVVGLTFLALSVLAWGLTRQVGALAAELPAYRQNIRAKIADVRNASRGGAVESVQSTIDDIKKEMSRDEPRPDRPSPVVVVPDSPAGLELPVWVSALAAPLGTAALVSVLVIFMLLEHRDLRDRLASLIGQGYLVTTTRALGEAATRVSRFLLMQTLVNLIYGVCVGIGLWLLGVPYPLLWAASGAALRFVPYIGPWIAAGGPILVTLAALPGWTHPVYVTALFIGLELLTNLVLETVLYAGAAGVTQVALLIGVAFWTWLWGPLGLLLSTPLTVCLVVLGKHVSGLRFLSTLIADEPPLPPGAMLYQRLLARERADAWDVVEQQLKARAPEELYDAVLIPALAYAERDRVAGGLTAEEEREIADDTLELMTRLDARAADAAGQPAADAETPPGGLLRILGYPVETVADEVALQMLSRLLRDVPVALDIRSSQMLISELIATVQDEGYTIVCLADLLPSSPARARHVVKRLHQAAPDVLVLVGRWGPPGLDADSAESLIESGAAHVGQTLVQTRNQVRELAAPVAPPASPVMPEPSV